MKIGVIGMGSQGTRLSRILTSLGQDVVGFDVAGEYDDPAHVWRYKLDAVVIASPAETHVHHLLRVVAAGITAIFVEKPLSDQMTPELKTLVAQTKDWPCQVGYNLRFDPRVQSMHASIVMPRFGWFHTASDIAFWGGQHYGSALLECSHEIDVALWMLGPAVCVGAVSDGHALSDLTLRHEYGANSHVHLNYCTKTSHRIHQVLMGDGEMRSAYITVPHDAMYHDEMAHWLSRIQAGTPTDVPLSVGLNTLQIIEEARCLSSSV